jgi:hypothetical protein
MIESAHRWCLVAAVTATMAPTVIPTPAYAQPSAYGLVTHDLDAPRADKLAALGAGFARVSVRWWQVEPQPDTFDWSALDEYVWAQAAPRGIRLFLSLGEPPAWAGGGPDHRGAPADLGRWRRFVRAVVDRYKGYVKHWGVWNEPDSPLFLDGRDAYRAIAQEARRAIKQADAEAFVLGPEVSEGALDDGWFAETMSEWGFETFDIVTVHVYSTRLADKMDRLVFPWTFGKDVWLTEIGRTATPGNIISEELQRIYYRTALQTFEARRWWWTKIFFYDIWNWDGQSRFGITGPEWAETRAFSAYRSWIAGASPVTASTDSDEDGLPDVWEGALGFDPTSDQGLDGWQADPDGDGLSNLDEFRLGSHPRGHVTRYLAEGASTPFLRTSLALLNLHPTAAGHVLLRYLSRDGRTTSRTVRIPPFARATIDAAAHLDPVTPAFATVVESDVPLVVDRTMRWGSTRGGAHSETALVAPSTEWFLAEGATHSGFQLFYLLQNPTDRPAAVEVTYLRPAPAPPLLLAYVVHPRSRLSVWVNQEHLGLTATDVSAAIVSDTPIVVERAMYRSTDGVSLGAGHASAGVTQARTRWFLAEGATGPFFDLFVLVANPDDRAAFVRATYLLPDGRTISRMHTVAARSRLTIWVDHDDPALDDTAVSTVVESLNGVPLVVERAMWWPGPTPDQWYEAHNSPGAVDVGTVWATAEGEQGGDERWETFVLIANTGDRPGRASVTLHFGTGATVRRTLDLAAHSRTNVMVSALFPEAAGRRFGVTVESLSPDPQPLIVERASYSSAGGVFWGRGTSAGATRLR